MRKSGAELLAEWIVRSGQTQREVAAEMDLTPAYLCQILKGKRRPGLPIAVRIKNRTGVPEAAWMDTPRGKSDRARKHKAELTNINNELIEVVKS